MPYRSWATVQGWVDDYIVAHPTVSNVVSVLEKDFTPGPDSGLVVISLRNATTVTYIQPLVDVRGPRWLVTFEPRADAFDLDAEGVARLSADLAVVSDICGYLQERTEQAMASATTSQA